MISNQIQRNLLSHCAGQVRPNRQIFKKLGGRLGGSTETEHPNSLISSILDLYFVMLSEI